MYSCIHMQQNQAMHLVIGHLLFQAIIYDGIGAFEKKQGIQNNRFSYSCWPRLLHSLGKSMKESQHHRHPFHLHKQIHPFGVQPRPRPSSPYKLAVLGVGKGVALPIGLLQPCIGENTHIVIQGHTTQSITHMESKLINHYIYINITFIYIYK